MSAGAELRPAGRVWWLEVDTKEPWKILYLLAVLFLNLDHNYEK
jgi:hypothetical protein